MSRARHIAYTSALLLWFLFPCVSPAASLPPTATQPAAPAKLRSTGDPIEQAVSRAKAYLYSQQHDGKWEVVVTPSQGVRDTVEGGQWGGLTALATYALLASGESPQDERLQRAVAFLASADLRGIYALGMRAQVWSILPPEPAVRLAAGRDASALQRALKTQGEARGLYGYATSSAEPWYDHSASQYGVLGMWACGRVGISIPPRYWQAVEGGFRRHQYTLGGWSYVWREDGQDRTGDYGIGPRFAMTEAGVASLLMCRDFLHSTDGLDCTGNIRDIQIEMGLRWLGEHAADAFETPASSRAHLSNDALWALARIGALTGRRNIGAVDWFERGTPELLQRQLPADGSWGNVPDTAFALLFLAQGRAPIAIQKLAYGITPRETTPKPGNWNQRPLDAANATAGIARRIRRPLNWQIVRLGDDDPDRYPQLASGPNEAPVLYISGNQTLEFTSAELGRLRHFAQGGGVILGHADGSSMMFADSFRELGAKLFPRYAFRDLPSDHPLFARGPFAPSNWKRTPFIQGLSNGCRELMLLLPQGDTARLWQTQWMARTMGGFEEARANEAAELASDLLYYAGDPSWLPTRTILQGLPAPVPQTKPAYSLAVARLQYEGNWDPEPAGWPRLVASLRTQQRVDLSVETVPLGEGKLPGYKVAHLTGTGRFRLSEIARDEIREFIDDGGTLFFEAAGGSTEFTASAEAELTTLFGERAGATVLGISHPVYSAGQRIDTVEYRRAAKRLLGDLRTPRLRGFDVHNRTAIFISPEDLSSALTSTPADGIIGYAPASASALMGNILLYASRK